MPSFRVTYHTTGGPFSRTVEAQSAEFAEMAALSELEAEPTLAFTEKDIRFTIRPAQVAAISVEEDKTPSGGGERRAAGFGAR